MHVSKEEVIFTQGGRGGVLKQERTSHCTPAQRFGLEGRVEVLILWRMGCLEGQFKTHLGRK